MEKILKSKLLFLTKNAMAKIVDGSEFDATKKTIAATKLGDDDELLMIAAVSDEERQILLVTNDGFAIRFGIDEIPEKKKNAVGVRAMKLQGSDKLEGAYLMNYGDERTFVFAEKEYMLTSIKTSKRDGKGVKIH